MILLKRLSYITTNLQLAHWSQDKEHLPFKPNVTFLSIRRLSLYRYISCCIKWASSFLGQHTQKVWQKGTTKRKIYAWLRKLNKRSDVGGWGWGVLLWYIGPWWFGKKVNSLKYTSPFILWLLSDIEIGFKSLNWRLIAFYVWYMENLKCLSHLPLL